jgi:hypothetical protein
MTAGGTYTVPTISKGVAYFHVLIFGRFYPFIFSINVKVKFSLELGVRGIDKRGDILVLYA